MSEMANLPGKSPPSAQEKQTFTSRQIRGFTAATLAAIPLAMGVTVFDRSVIQYANGSAKSLQEAVFKGWKNVLGRPVHTFNSLDNRAVMAVYVPTYITKNLVEASCDYRGINPFYPVFFITAAINTTLGIMKDRYLAQLFGSGVPNFPRTSYALFTARDSVIVGSSFNGPIILSPILQRELGWGKETSDTVAQLACPGFAQIIGTPIHLIGLDLYNRPEITPMGRFDGLLRRTLEPLVARMARQIYVFGIGGILVKKTGKAFGYYDPTNTANDSIYIATATSSTK